MYKTFQSVIQVLGVHYLDIIMQLITTLQWEQQLFLEVMPGECIKQSVIQVLGVHYLDICTYIQTSYELTHKVIHIPCSDTGCLQGFVFENGPLSPETTLNYSYQLFEALDYLHQRLKVIHCDIKREFLHQHNFYTMLFAATYLYIIYTDID